jgi:capsular polysaccharide biosynthesis protein
MQKEYYSELTPILMQWQRIVLFGVIGMVIALLASLIRPLEYSATTRLGITQELGSVDAYTASRSAERIADNLAAAVYHSVVFTAILDDYGQVDDSYFGDDARKQRKRWEDTVAPTVSRGRGELTIRAYHPNPVQAEAISEAVSDYLIREGWRFTSGGGINIQLVDDALVSRFPVRPNLIVNALSGFIVGAFVAIGLVLLQIEGLKRKHQIVPDRA